MFTRMNVQLNHKLTSPGKFICYVQIDDARNDNCVASLLSEQTF